MIELLKGWVLNIAGVCILVVLAEIIIPSGKMKKYIAMVSGFLILLAVIKPLTVILDEGMQLKDYQTANAALLDRKIIEGSGKVVRDTQMKQIAEVYREKVITHIEELAVGVQGVADAEADVIINEDYTSEDFGELRRVYLYITENIENKAGKKTGKIDKIKVGSQKPDEAHGEVSETVSNAIETRLSEVFNIEKANIVISLKER